MSVDTVVVFMAALLGLPLFILSLKLAEVIKDRNRYVAQNAWLRAKLGLPHSKETDTTREIPARLASPEL